MKSKPAKFFGRTLCPTSGKVRFETRTAARKRAKKLRSHCDADLWTYRCPHCGDYHFTKKTGGDRQTMSVDELLRILKDRDLSLAMVNGSPVIRGDRSQVTDTLLVALKRYRTEIIKYLQEHTVEVKL